MVFLSSTLLMKKAQRDFEMIRAAVLHEHLATVANLATRHTGEATVAATRANTLALEEASPLKHSSWPSEPTMPWGRLCAKKCRRGRTLS